MAASFRAAAGQRIYEDFVPSHKVIQGKEADTLVIELSGFRKQHLRVQVTDDGKLKISGERPLGDNRWSRFHGDFSVPENCNVSDIMAILENEHLYVVLPKLITEATVRDRPAEAVEPMESRSPTRGDAEKKVGEKEKDQKTKEEKDKEKAIGSEVKHEEGYKGGAIDDVQKEEARTELAAPSNGRNGLGKLKVYEPRRFMVNVVVAGLALVGLWLYLIYTLKE